MESHTLIAWLVIGAIAGWLAGTFVKGGGFGLIGDIVVGIIGAFIGGWLAGVLHINVGSGWVSTILTAAAGAVLLLVLLRAVRRA
ncbi:MAG TPA: GlsB/YeaQ/YmgE family stress response membrane protein [Phenylobacterium sp.]|nr:GlsB/YeaQ/YmgE family stress response membrane protein [Phenylobacterium sp.]